MKEKMTTEQIRQMEKTELMMVLAMLYRLGHNLDEVAHEASKMSNEIKQFKENEKQNVIEFTESEVSNG